MPEIKQFHLKLTPDVKQMMNASAQKLNLTASEYIRTLIKKDRQSMTHEEKIQTALSSNQFVNGLLVNPDIPNKYKQIIGKELKKYVNNKN